MSDNYKKDEDPENKIKLSQDDNTNGDDIDENGPEPIEYKPPFPLEKVAVGVVVAIIIILLAVIILRNILKNTVDDIKNSGEDTTEMTTSDVSDIFSISDDIDVAVSLEKDFSDIVIKNLNSITCWGDEYMSGAKTNELSIPTYIARNISGKYTVFNAGCYNEDINGIAERQGGVYIEIMPIVIPSEPMEIPVELKNMFGEDCNVHISADKNGGLNPVYINGVEGTLTATGHGYTFKRTSKGDELRITHPTIVKTKGSIDRNNDIQIIFVGKNQNYDADRLVNVYKAMVNYMNPLVKSYIIVGIAEGTAQSQKELEDKMTSEFGRHYINIRDYMANYAMAELGMTPTEEDSALMAQGSVPKSLMDGDTQFTAEANEAIAKLICERLTELNIL